MNGIQEDTKISKQSGHWTREEHERFLLGLNHYGKDWKRIVECVGTRSNNQVRSHAQKYFLKLEKKNSCFASQPEKSSQVYLKFLQTLSYNACVRFMAEMQKQFTMSHVPETKPVQIIVGKDDEQSAQ